MANYRYQYETSPRELEPDYEQTRDNYRKKKKNISKKKQEKVQPRTYLKRQIKIVVCIFLFFSSLLVISYRNSLINESFNHNESLKANLAAIEKQNEQLKVNLENSLNLSNIEKLAEEKLGMQKLDNSQKVYVSLDKKDYVEAASEEVKIEEDKTWIEQLLDTLLGR